MANVTVSHIGLCVSDLEASLRFYIEGLGFEVAEAFDVGDEVAHTLEVEQGVVLKSQMIQKDGMKIELLGWTSPAAVRHAVDARGASSASPTCRSTSSTSPPSRPASSSSAPR